MVQVIEHSLKATLNQSAVDVQRCVKKSSMTHGYLSHHGQKTHHFLEQGKHNMKSTFLGNLKCYISSDIILLRCASEMGE